MAGKWTANRDLYFNTQGHAVEAGDPSAAFLLVRAGRTLTAAQMKQYKVKKAAPRSKADKPAKPKAEAKPAAKKPAAGKSAAKPKPKGGKK